jgi:hypothetical protein
MGLLFVVEWVAVGIDLDFLFLAAGLNHRFIGD